MTATLSPAPSCADRPDKPDRFRDRFAIRLMPDGEIVDRNCTYREAAIWLHTYNVENRTEGTHVEAVAEPSCPIPVDAPAVAIDTSEIEQEGL